MASFDYSAPFVAARIIDREGDAFPLWTNISGVEATRPNIPGPDELQALAFLQEVQVKMDQGYVPTITAQLAPPFRDGIRFLDSRLVDAGGDNRLEVQFGYTAGTSGGAVLSPVFIGTISKPDITVDIEVQIALNAQGLGGYGATRGEGNIVAREGETRRQLIERIAGAGGRILRVNFEDVDSEPNGAAATALNAPAEGFAQGNRTDWLALYQLANQTRCWMSLVGDTLFWLSRRHRLLQPPRRVYRMYDYPGGRLEALTPDALRGLDARGATLPLLSFTSATEAAWLAHGRGFQQRDVDPASQEAVEAEITPASMAEPVGAPTGSVTVADAAEPPAARTVPGDPGDTEARTTAEEDASRGSNLGVQIEIEVPGDPQILPGDTIRIAGLGARFDQNTYAVYTVTHSAGVGGFTTNLVAISNIDSLLSRFDGGEAATGAPNTAEVEGGESYVAEAGEISDEELSQLTGVRL